MANGFTGPQDVGDAFFRAFLTAQRLQQHKEQQKLLKQQQEEANLQADAALQQIFTAQQQQQDLSQNPAAQALFQALANARNQFRPTVNAFAPAAAAIQQQQQQQQAEVLARQEDAKRVAALVPPEVRDDVEIILASEQSDQIKLRLLREKAPTRAESLIEKQRELGIKRDQQQLRLARSREEADIIASRLLGLPEGVVADGASEAILSMQTDALNKPDEIIDDYINFVSKNIIDPLTGQTDTERAATLTDAFIGLYARKFGSEEVLDALDRTALPIGSIAIINQMIDQGLTDKEIIDAILDSARRNGITAIPGPSASQLRAAAKKAIRARRKAAIVGQR